MFKINSDNPSNYFDYAGRMQHIEVLNKIVDKPLNIFDDAVKSTVDDFKVKLKKWEEEDKETRKKIQQLQYNEDDPEFMSEYSSMFTDIDINQFETEWKLNQLLSLAEMRVVFLYKSLELMMTQLILHAYPGILAKDLNRWDNITTIYKQKGIVISDIKGYIEAGQLKDVNNKIKHDGKIDYTVAKIKEFKNEQEFTYLNIEAFYNRVYPLIGRFTQELCKQVIDNLYKFEDKKIKKIVDSYSERMDKPTLKKLIDALQAKLKS